MFQAQTKDAEAPFSVYISRRKTRALVPGRPKNTLGLVHLPREMRVKKQRLSILIAAPAAAQAASAAEPSVTAVKARRLLDVKTGHYVERPVVVVRGDK